MYNKMKNIKDFLFESNLRKELIAEDYNEISEGMINESFKASILTKLAKAISDAMKDYNKREKDNAKRLDKEYGGKHTANTKNFASIFGPKVLYGRYGNKKTGLQGVKWSEISDDDFKVFTEYDKELENLIKGSYKKKDGNTDFIIIDKNDNIKYFIKGYGYEDDGKAQMNGIYTFKSKWGGGPTVQEIEKDAYKYSSKPLNITEVIAFVIDLLKNEYKVYALTITGDMVQNYEALHTAREESHGGVIEYDEASLRKLAEQQRARYKALAKEARIKKEKENAGGLFDEIKELNDEVTEIYRTITSKPEYIDKFYDLGDIMNYINYVYECYFKYIKYARSSEKNIEVAKQNGEKNPEIYGSFDKKHSDESLNDVREYINRVKKQIEKIKSQL